MTYTVDTAKKILEVVDAGLIEGLGQPAPGEMCVEAAICYALDLPHGDDPGCVEQAVRQFKICLNDSCWSSNEARARGLRALAVAQLGSKGVIDGRAFATRLAEQTIRQIVPIALRAAAERSPRHAHKLEASAVMCEQEGTRDSALKAKGAAYAAADAAAASAAYDAYVAAATAYDAYAAAATAYAAAADAYAADAAAYAASASAYAASAASAADDAADAARDRCLTKIADLALGILRDLRAPGVALWDQVNQERETV